MPLILALDNSHQTLLSLALYEDDSCLGHLQIQTTFHNSSTAQMVDRTDALLKSANHTIQDITIYIVNRGPGSFTGLRSSMAFAQGLALSSGAPLYGISAFEALQTGYTQTSPSEKTAYLLDTKCQSYYVGLHSGNAWQHDVVTFEKIDVFLEENNVKTVVSDNPKPNELNFDGLWIIKTPDARLLVNAWHRHQNQQALINPQILYLKSPV
ncbi:MAG: tRNA (adenosine(37)-N6)-threonylcarbamoyltransferase complex dimerization subunit type 1 TsaB [Rickettsiales bacterium]|nr:tRNA (adenosine(37)-N6)-threonylcarbamoyltransferase complex dimerization subunit type 1 TsaB [Rickettsiales bacterium]|tara:strand:- start:79273 stop:79905 length:633 start_codon:yes stop_codon:yes gene_type:complete